MTFGEQIAAHEREIAYLDRIGHTTRSAELRRLLDVTLTVMRNGRKSRSSKINVRDYYAINETA